MPENNELVFENEDEENEYWDKKAVEYKEYSDWQASLYCAY